MKEKHFKEEKFTYENIEILVKLGKSLEMSRIKKNCARRAKIRSPKVHKSKGRALFLVYI